MQAIPPQLSSKETVLTSKDGLFNPLPVAVFGVSEHDSLLVVLTRWTLSAQERAAIAAGDDVYVLMTTSDQTVQPLSVHAGLAELGEFTGAASGVAQQTQDGQVIRGDDISDVMIEGAQTLVSTDEGEE